MVKFNIIWLFFSSPKYLEKFTSKEHNYGIWAPNSVCTISFVFKYLPWTVVCVLGTMTQCQWEIRSQVFFKFVASK